MWQTWMIPAESNIQKLLVILRDNVCYARHLMIADNDVHQKL